MRASNSRLLLSQDEVILIKNSETAKNSEIYGSLYIAVQQFRVVSEKDLQENSLFDDKAKVVVLNNKKMLIDNIKDEWSGIGCSDESTTEIRCQLCSHPNRWVFYIKNRDNNNELHVGSECIKKFKGIENINQITKDRGVINKRLSREKRIVEFEQIDLNNINFIKEAEEKFHAIDIVLPFMIYEGIRLSLYNLNSIRTDYITNGGDITEVAERYFDLKSKNASFWKEAENFYNQMNQHPLICNKDIGDWIKNLMPNIWEQISKNEGQFSFETLKFIYKSSFIKTHLTDFERHNSDSDTKILGLNGNNIVFQIKNGDYFTGLTFEVTGKWFMENIGCSCLTDNTFCYDRTQLKKLSIIRTNSNLASILDRINYIIEKLGYIIEISEITEKLYYKRLKKIDRKNKFSKETVVVQEEGYRPVSRDYIFDIFQSLIFSDDKEIQYDFTHKFKIIEIRKNWISRKEKEENEKLAADAASMSKQKEFIPYV